MAKSFKGPKGHNPKELKEAKLLVAKLIGGGASVQEAMSAVNRTKKTYEHWRAHDPNFREMVNAQRSGSVIDYEDRVNQGFPDFADFSKKYLDAEVFPHMQNVVDLMEGKDPSWVHPAMNWDRNEPDLAIVNMPPEHGKSTTLTMNYLCYRIVQDPNVRIIVISKTQTMANKFLYGIKTRLPHPKE